MPVQYPTGILAEHKWTREHAGLFDVSHMGPSFLTLAEKSADHRADHAAVAALVEPLVCGDIRGLKPGRDPLYASSQRCRRHRRRSVHRAAAPTSNGPARSTSSSTPAPRTATSPALRKAAGDRATTDAERRLRPRRAARAGGRRRHGRARPRRRRSRLHDLRLRFRMRGHHSFSSRAPATPARTASRSWSPPEAAVAFWRRLTADERVKPDRPRRPRLAAPRSGPAAQRPRPRRDRRPRSRRTRLSPSRSAGARPPTFPALPASSRNSPTARRASASACWSRARLPAKAPRSWPATLSSVASPAAALRRPSAARSPWATSRRLTPPPAQRSSVSVRGRAQARDRRRASLRSPPLRPQARLTRIIRDEHPLHPRPRMDQP